ncbi:MiaB/RimO family radical SAM methylthiotransferase [Candidatus Peregrinibacteria bacterium]|nr:MiaB/RimO family radical SAM methylthiotransferase [Candidatus Peregrinibacteria bacterium]
MKYFIKTYGCQMNTSDTERVMTILEALGYEKTETLEDTDLVIFNSCSVKQKAEDKGFGAIKDAAKFRKKNPNLLIGLTGCMIRQSGVKADRAVVKEHGIEGLPKWRQERALELKKRGLLAKKGVDPLFVRLSRIDFVFRIEDVSLLGDLLKEANPNLKLNKIIDEGTLENYFKITPRQENKVQAFVPIMTGCDKFCTYCIVPFTRGREFSRPLEEVVKECTELVENGAEEITLIGQTVNTYGLSRFDRASHKFDWYYNEGGQISSAYRGNKEDTSGVEKPFATLLKKIDSLKEKGLKRLRYTSPHPRDFTDDVIEVIAKLETICPHIHMPVQSGSDTVLKRMNRNYTVEEYMKMMMKMKDLIPNLSITTDIIVGFSGETDEEFEETFQMYDSLEWDFCYISQYSPRKGTVSERMMDDDVPRETKKIRWDRLNELMKTKIHKKNLSYVGKVVEVLVEKSVHVNNSSDRSENPPSLIYLCSGRTPDSKEVQFQSPEPLIGKFINVKVTEGLEWLLRGEIS